MNELKLILHNFQSITDGELTFKTGLNFIIGQSNSGKSATFRALKACLANPSGSQRFIKKGSKKAEVTLLYNGNEILWERTPKESSYIINGEEFVKTGSSDAFKILNDDTGFNKDFNNTIMNIEEELQIPFPFGINKFDLFKLYENVFCVSDSALILKSAKEHEDEIKGELSTIELELNKNKVKKEAVKSFKNSVDLSKLNNFKTYLNDRVQRKTFLLDGKELIDRALKIEEAQIILKECNFANLLTPYAGALEVKKALTQVKVCHSLSKSLQELQCPQLDRNRELEELEAIRRLIKQLTCLNDISIEVKSFSSLIGSYDRLIDLKKLFLLLKKLNQLKFAEKIFENKLTKLEELKKLKKDVQNIKEKIKDLKEKQQKTEEQEVNIQAKLQEFKVCPLCHHELE